MKNNKINKKFENIKVDLFQKDSSMRERVSDFMNKKIWGITLRTRYKKEVAECNTSIEGLQKLLGSIQEEHAKESIKALSAKVEELTTKLSKQMTEEARFEFTDADNQLYLDYKKSENAGQVRVAILKWFKTYNLDVRDNDAFVAMFMTALAGERKASAKTIVCSEATRFTNSKRTKNDILTVFYGKLSEIMLEKGALKASVIPEDVREFYCPKKVKKSEK